MLIEWIVNKKYIKYLTINPRKLTERMTKKQTVEQCTQTLIDANLTLSARHPFKL